MSGKIVLAPVFKTKEQERLFAKCAQESMSTTAFLELEDSSKDKVIVSPVFKTKEQERIFTECAEESMSITEELKW